jgi:hypothetical protein
VWAMTMEMPVAMEMAMEMAIGTVISGGVPSCCCWLRVLLQLLCWLLANGGG